ncbi:polar amino acid ABC transporter permease [Rhodoferax sp. AJA081-3]|uniref:polar amino acid ABC transporter permease n=1 Tax=Rhodoferax sp. AJA081-3 TaxID=2752316 RepID=UPI001ADFF56C|nr:polar amino acid ABC transporter permease [Rhodoferax sp. AJA081-3]QTN26304.1 polar amino acid ABC transporter permease [Rhodoferax sp. AJA081-3]
MNAQETTVLQELWVWTPFLLSGFAINILIGITAMVIGTGLGWCLALLRLSTRPRVARFSLLITEFTRNIPTMVFQFYLVFMLPSTFKIPGTSITLGFPVWLVAALALAIAVVGFTSDNLTKALRDWRRGDHGVAFLFIPSWTSYMLIIVIASSTASIIGVSELVSRCNTVVNATGRTSLMLPVYLYACALFFLFCYPLTQLMRKVHTRLAARMQTS